MPRADAMLANSVAHVVEPPVMVIAVATSCQKNRASTSVSRLKPEAALPDCMGRTETSDMFVEILS